MTDEQQEFLSRLVKAIREENINFCSHKTFAKATRKPINTDIRPCDKCIISSICPQLANKKGDNDLPAFEKLILKEKLSILK